MIVPNHHENLPREYRHRTSYKRLTIPQLGKTLYHQGDLSYFEAVNKETLKNAYERFQEEGLIIVSKPRKDSKEVPKIKLAPEWTPRRDPKTGQIIAEGRLWDFIEMIAQSRREGKNRRDGATVSTRVVALADKLGRMLFDNIEPTAGNGDHLDEELRQRKVRRKSLGVRANL